MHEPVNIDHAKIEVSHAHDTRFRHYPEVIKDHGISPDEYERIKKLFGPRTVTD